MMHPRYLVAIAAAVLVAAAGAYFITPPVCKPGEKVFLVAGQPSAGCPATQRPATDFKVF